MKAEELIPLLFLCLALSCGNSASDQDQAVAESPEIDIRIEGAPSGKAYLIATYTDQNYRIDSSEINDQGHFRFQRDEPYPAGLLYVLLPDESYIQLLLDKDQTFSLQTRAGLLVESMEVEGNLETELLYESLAMERVLQPKFEEIADRLARTTPGTSDHRQIKDEQDELSKDRAEFLEVFYSGFPNSFFTAFKKAGQNPEIVEVFRPDGSLDTERQLYLYRSQFWDNVDFGDARLLRTPVISNKLNRYISDLTPQNADSIKRSAGLLLDKVLDHPEYYKYFANWIALKYEPTRTTLMDSEAVFVFMVQNYFTPERAYWSDSLEIYGLQGRAREMSSSLIGMKGPDVEALDPSRNTRSISAITTPYVVVFMYNPTCDHCIEETPKLVSLYHAQTKKEFEVYAIAIDTDNEHWRQFVAANNMDWINVFDPTNRAFYGKYFVDNTPEVYVLNPDRTIIGKNLKVSQIMEVIRKDKSGQM